MHSTLISLIICGLMAIMAFKGYIAAKKNKPKRARKAFKKSAILGAIVAGLTFYRLYMNLGLSKDIKHGKHSPSNNASYHFNGQKGHHDFEDAMPVPPPKHPMPPRDYPMGPPHPSMGPPPPKQRNHGGSVM